MPKTSRRCPSCGVVQAASTLLRVPGIGVFGTTPQVRCPACGHIALRTWFRQVEPSSGGEGAGGPLPGEPGAQS